MHPDGGVQALGRLPGAVADAGHALILAAGLGQGNLVAVAGDLVAALEVAGVKSPEVTRDPQRADVFDASGEVAFGISPFALQAAIQTTLGDEVDSQGSTFELSLPLPETTSVGQQVVGELRDKAVLALLISLIVIVIYIRVRFAEYSYGLAAVAALTHDVLITLGVLSVFMWVGALGVEINLPMIAAFLTIIGYSLNDTIVVFDRVRENLPRMKKPLAEILDTSINQTLSRTIMTSMTTLIVVSLLFVFNFGSGNVLVGFSLAMISGVLVGTYSSMFIACPLLHFFENARMARQAREAKAAPLGGKTTKEAVV